MKKTKNTCKEKKNSCKLSKFIEIFMTQGGRERGSQHSQHGLLLSVSGCLRSVPCWVHSVPRCTCERREGWRMDRDVEWERRRHLPTFKVAIYLNQRIHVLSAFGIQTCNWYYCPITLTHLFLHPVKYQGREVSKTGCQNQWSLTCWRRNIFPSCARIGIKCKRYAVSNQSFTHVSLISFDLGVLHQ